MKGKDLKPHIGIFGRRNLGKSSLINTLTGQDVAIVSDFAGTTTDPVKKSMEIFGIGPVIITDTAGIDDEGYLGGKRIEKSLSVIPNVDLAVLIISDNVFDEVERNIINAFNEYDLPFIIVYSKSDISKMTDETKRKIREFTDADFIEISIFDKKSIENLVDLLKKRMPETTYLYKSLFKGIIKPKEIVLLITPIDSEAPEGRMILPQVMALRDVLDNDAICVIVKETEIIDFLKTGIKPALTVTDSQAFEYVSKVIPKEIPLTSFSITLARYRGNFEKYIEGTPYLSKLQNGDTILMLESCTHQISCDDIGRYKLPLWIRKFTGKEINFDYASGLSTFPKPIEEYAMVIQCGGCVVTQKQINNRLLPFVKRNIPVSNYGMSIAYLNGIFDRAMEPFIK